MGSSVRGGDGRPPYSLACKPTPQWIYQSTETNHLEQAKWTTATPATNGTPTPATCDYTVFDRLNSSNVIPWVSSHPWPSVRAIFAQPLTSARQ